MTPASQQADRCPFPRPFAPDFVECPAFQAIAFIAADSHNKPLGSWHSCRHLTAGNDVEQRGRFYPRCALGSREQRLQWLGQVTPARLAVVRALQHEFDAFSLPHREILYEARARLQTSSSTASAQQEIEQLINAFLEAIDRFLLANTQRFHDVGLPPDSLRQLIHEWIWAWVRSPEMGTPGLNPASREPLANTPRAFLGLKAQPAAVPSRRLWDQPLYSDPILEIVPTIEPVGFAMVGDVDASNLPAVTSALMSMRETSGDIHLDLSGLLFCDLGGLQAIVRFAQALGDGRKLVLHGIPRQLERALEILDWLPLANLTIERISEGQAVI